MMRLTVMLERALQDERGFAQQQLSIEPQAQELLIRALW